MLQQLLRYYVRGKYWSISNAKHNHCFLKIGWGTTEFGGPRSKVLMKTNLELVNIQKCVSAYGSNIEPSTQLCTYTAKTDACQVLSLSSAIVNYCNLITYKFILCQRSLHLKLITKNTTYNVNPESKSTVPFLKIMLTNFVSQ